MTAIATPDMLEQIRQAQRENEEGRRALQEIGKSMARPGRQPGDMIQRHMRTQEPASGVWHSPAHFLKAVMECPGKQYAGHADMTRYVNTMEGQLRQKALPSGLNEVVGSDGGFLVPPEFVNMLLMRTYENDLLSRCTLIPTTSNMLKIPAISETSRANGSRFGGARAYWRSEAGTIDATKFQLDQVSIEPEALTLLMRATDQLLQDATSLEAWASLVAEQEFAFVIGDAIVNGDGITKPLGLLSSPSKIEVSAEAGQPADTILAENILAMWARLHVSCHKNAVWLVDPSAAKELPKMTLGTAGAQMVVYMPAGGLSGLPYPTLMGRPVIVTEFNSVLGNAGDIILADLSTFLMATRQGLQTAVSMHVYFVTNEQAFRWTMRLNGKSWWISSIVPKSGGDSLSNIVTLAAR